MGKRSEGVFHRALDMQPGELAGEFRVRRGAVGKVTYRNVPALQSINPSPTSSDAELAKRG